LKNRTTDCILEPAVKPPESGNMTNLPKQILERPDLAIIVTGSLACIRGIYKTVAGLGKLHQFHYCVLDEEDYLSEAWIEKYANIINKVLQRKGLGGIIVYAGCLDMLAKVNLTKVKPLLNNPLQIPVEILFRGPVAAAVRKPKEVLPELLAKIPPTDKELARNSFVLPPLLPDFVGVAAMLEKRNSHNIVLDIGGCSACISPSDGNSFKSLKKTTFKGYTGLKQYKDCLDKVILAANSTTPYNTCTLLETPVIKKAQLDMSWLEEKLAHDNMIPVNLGTNGYNTSAEGIAKALVQFGEQAKKLCANVAVKTNPRLIGVLGADSGQSAFQEKIHHGIEHFIKDGYSALFPEDLSWEKMSELATVRINWVVSSVAIPLAEYMQKEFGIPYFAAIPIGARAMFLWRNQVNRMMQNSQAKLLEIPPIALPASKQKKVLIVGDPILTAGIKRYFVAMEGYLRVDRAIYAPIPSFAAFCLQVTKQDNAQGLQDEVLPITDSPILFKDTQAWKELASQYDIIVCDKLMQLCLGDTVVPELWINIPDGILSTGLVKAEDYTIFGKKGAAWLRAAQNIKTEEQTSM